MSGQELANACLPVQIIDYRRVFAGERFEALFAAWIRQPAGVKNETAAMSALILRRGALVK